MAEELTSNPSPLTSAPIVPSLPELESAVDPMQALNTPAPVIMPVLPSGTPDSALVNQQLQGSYSTGPNPGARQGEVLSKGTEDYAKALVNYINDEEVLNDRYKYGRAYAYGSGYKNLNFDRYYKHPKFKELGFSPYSDNDTYYNQRSSWWDDFSRMRGEFLPLAWAGAKSLYGSEEDANEAMEKGMAVGMSTKEGAGAWVTNFGLNSAYTVGIMGALAVENAVLSAVEAATFGVATPAVGAAAYARNSMGIGKMAKAITGTADFIRNLKKAGAAKDFFTAAKVGEKATDFAKWINPFERTLEWSTHLAKGTGGVKDLKNMAKVSKTFGNFYKDLRELNTAHSEAALEGEGASTEYQNQLIDEFYAANGRMPEGEEARNIYERAQSVKASVTLANDATIYLTNKLVFDDLFDGFTPGKGLMKSYMEGSGRFFERTAAKDFKAGTTAAYQATEATFGQKTKDFLLKSEYVPWSKTYFLGNLGEALQENAQEVITQSALDYYDKIHKDPAQNGFYGALSSIGKSISGQFSAQGFDTFLQGYLMGSLIQGGSKGVMAAGRQVFDRTGLAAEKEQAEQTENEKYNAANFVLENALIYGGHQADIASGIRAAKQAKDNAVQDGDVKAARDRQAEMQINYYEGLARTKSMNLITDHVNDMLSLEDKDLENAFDNKESASAIRQKLSNLKDRAEAYQENYDRVKRIKPNPYNPWMYSGKNKDGSYKYPEQYNNEMFQYLAHERVTNDIIFATSMHQDIVDRMEKMMNVLSGQGPLQNFYNKKTGQAMTGADLTVLIDPIQRRDKRVELRSLISVMKEGTPDQKKEAKILQQELDFFDEWDIFADTLKTELREASKIGATGKPEGVQFALKNLYKSYREYIKIKTAGNKGYVFEDQVAEGFKYIRDFLDISIDEMKAVNTINTLSDPEMFNRYVEIQKDIQKKAQENKVRNLNEGFEKFKRMSEKNKMLKEIFGLGLFVLPEDVAKINNYEVTDFYNVTTKALVGKDDPKYKEAIEIVRKYGRAAGVDYADEIVSPDKHVIKRNADKTFSVISPKGNIVGAPLKTKEDAEKIAADLDLAMQEAAAKEAAAKAKAEAEAKAKAAAAAKTPTDIEAKKADIEKRRQEELKKYEGRRANSFVKYNPEGANTELTQDEIDEVELLINKAAEKGWTVDRLQQILARRGYVHATGNSVTALRSFLQARLSGEINYQANGSFLNEINAKYDEELAALEATKIKPSTNIFTAAPTPSSTPPPPAMEFPDGFTIESEFATYTVERQIPNKDEYIVEIKTVDGARKPQRLTYNQLLDIYNQFKDYRKKEEPISDIVTNLMEQYTQIGTYDDLKSWVNNVTVILGNVADIDAVIKLHGIDLRLEAEKMEKDALASIVENSKKIENLEPGLAVFLSDRTAMIVLQNDGKTVTLVSPGDYNNLRKAGEKVPSQEAIDNFTGNKVQLTEADLKDKIKMISGTPQEAAEVVKPLTEEQVKESDQGLAATKTDTAEELNKDFEASKKTTVADAKKSIFDTINKCNNPK